MAKDEQKQQAQDQAAGAAVATEEAKVEVVVEDPEVVKQKLVAELTAAIKSGDYQQIAAVSRKLDGFERENEKKANEARLNALKVLGDEVSKVIMGVVQPLIDAGKLDTADGVWFSYDFGDKQPVTRLTKTAVKAKSGGGGGGGVGKKFDVTTDQLLEKHGSTEYKDGATHQQAWDASTDKNDRYNVRKSLLKLEGLL